MRADTFAGRVVALLSGRAPAYGVASQPRSSLDVYLRDRNRSRPASTARSRATPQEAGDSSPPKPAATSTLLIAPVASPGHHNGHPTASQDSAPPPPECPPRRAQLLEGIHQLITARQRSVQNLADELGRPRSALAFDLSGTRTPSWAHVQEILLLLGVNDLAAWEGLWREAYRESVRTPKAPRTSTASTAGHVNVLGGSLGRRMLILVTAFVVTGLAAVGVVSLSLYPQSLSNAGSVPVGSTTAGVGPSVGAEPTPSSAPEGTPSTAAVSPGSPATPVQYGRVYWPGAETSGRGTYAFVSPTSTTLSAAYVLGQPLELECQSVGRRVTPDPSYIGTPPRFETNLWYRVGVDRWVSALYVEGVGAGSLPTCT